MKAKISTRTVQSSQPTEKPYVLSDTEISGFQCRIEPSGSKSFYLRYWQHGRRQVRKLGRVGEVTPAQARQAAKAILSAIAKGEEPEAKPSRDVTVRGLSREYLDYARGYYGPDSVEFDNVKRSLERLSKHCGNTALSKFTPKRLKGFMEHLVEAGHSRSGVNRTRGHVLRFVRWAVTEEHVQGNVLESLRAVPGLRRGKTQAAESEPVQPVSIEDVEAAKQHLSSPLAAVVDLLRLTGARPSEILSLRPCDIDTSTDIWTASPQHHKTAHHGKSRIIFFGPRAQGVLRPFMLRGDNEYLFNPREALAESRQGKVGRRPGQPESERRTSRKVGEFYDVAALRKAIARACRAAGIPTWNPYRLRHSCATQIRREYGLEGSQVVLGHAQLGVTQVYAEKNQSLAERIMSEVG